MMYKTRVNQNMDGHSDSKIIWFLWPKNGSITSCKSVVVHFKRSLGKLSTATLIVIMYICVASKRQNPISNLLSLGFVSLL